MRKATEIYSREFDSIFFDLPLRWRAAIQEAIHDLGTRLESYPHVRLQGRLEFRMRVSDYRIIYDFNVTKNELFLITLGHRREIYR